MELRKKLSLGRPVSKISTTKNETLLTIDDKGNIRDIDTENFSVLKGLKSSLENSIWNHQVELSKDGEIFVYIVPNSSTALIYSISQKKRLYTLKDSRGIIKFVHTDNSHRYLVVGLDKGFVTVYDLQTGTEVKELPKLPNEITSIEFNDNNTVLAIGDSAGDISVFNFKNLKLITTFKNTHKIRQLTFLNATNVISLDSVNDISLWSVTDGKRVEKLINLKVKVSKISISLDRKFLFIATQFGRVILFHLETYYAVDRRFIKTTEPIVDIVSCKKTGDLIVGDSQGNIYFYQIYKDLTTFTRYLKLKKYEQAYEIANENPMIKLYREYHLLEEIWQKLFMAAEKQLEKGVEDTIRIELMLEDFSFVPEKKEIIDNIVKDFQFFVNLQNFFNDRNFYLAYDLVKKHPLLKKTNIYGEMEKIWNTHYGQAKDVIFKRGGQEVAEELLNKFRGISQKSVYIKELLDSNFVYDFTTVTKIENKFELEEIKTILKESHVNVIDIVYDPDKDGEAIRIILQAKTIEDKAHFERALVKNGYKFHTVEQ